MYGRQCGGFPIVLLAVDLSTHPFKGQSTIHKHHFAIGFASHTLGLEIERIDVEPVVGQAEVLCQGHVGALGGLRWNVPIRHHTKG